MDEIVLDLISIGWQKKALKNELKQLEDREEELKEKAMSYMAGKQLKLFENDEIKLTYVEPSKRVILDSQRLRKEKPNLFDEYKTETVIKENLRITLKENN